MEICEKNRCSGCGACNNICPQNAIRMIYKDNGFLYPEIDKEKCVNCGLCKKVCPNNINVEFHKCYGAYLYRNGNATLRKKSSSGGAFIDIARKIVSQNGIVFGAEFDKYNNIQHNNYSNLNDVQRFCTSKYVQSDIKKSFKEVYTNLMDGKVVLFSGTPCQVAGIKSYLSIRKCNVDKLVTVDFVCHGVPSPKVWKKYLDEVEKTEWNNYEEIAASLKLYLKSKNLV